jgi:hypothetical protein
LAPGGWPDGLRAGARLCAPAICGASTGAAAWGRRRRLPHWERAARARAWGGAPAVAAGAAGAQWGRRLGRATGRVHMAARGAPTASARLRIYAGGIRNGRAGRVQMGERAEYKWEYALDTQATAPRGTQLGAGGWARCWAFWGAGRGPRAAGNKRCWGEIRRGRGLRNRQGAVNRRGLIRTGRRGGRRWQSALVV